MFSRSCGSLKQRTVENTQGGVFHPAVAAIIKQQNPGISLGALKTALQNSATDAGKKGADPFYGKGWVNALRACQQ